MDKQAQDALMIRGYLAGYMQKEAQGQAQPPMPGQGMGPGMPAQGSGFPINPEMAMNAQDPSMDPQALAQQQAEEQAREQKLEQMGQELNDLKYQAEETKVAGDIYKEKMKIKKQQEEMKQAAVEQQTDQALGSMLGRTSPGESATPDTI